MSVDPGLPVHIQDGGGRCMCVWSPSLHVTGLTVLEGRGCCCSTDPENTLEQKALLQGVVFHTSFPVFFPESSHTSLSPGINAGHSGLMVETDRLFCMLLPKPMSPIFNLTSPLLPFLSGLSELWASPGFYEEDSLFPRL